jgi:hypothetical protein
MKVVPLIFEKLPVSTEFSVCINVEFTKMILLFQDILPQDDKVASNCVTHFENTENYFK